MTTTKATTPAKPIVEPCLNDLSALLTRPNHKEKRLTIEELHAITSKAIAEGFCDHTVLVFSPSKKGYDICRQAKFERIWLDMKEGIVPSDPGVNALVLKATSD